MEKTSALKSTLTGLAASLLLIPVTTAVCAAATLKSGSASETAALCAYVCVFLSSFAGAFVAVKRSRVPERTENPAPAAENKPHDRQRLRRIFRCRRCPLYLRHRFAYSDIS